MMPLGSIRFIIAVLTAGSVFFAFAADDSVMDESVGQAVEQWLAIAGAQYDKAMFNQAEQSLLRAHDFYQYISPEQRQRIDELFDKLEDAVIEKQKLIQELKISDEMINNNQLAQAKTILEAHRDNKLLNEIERGQIDMVLKKIDSLLIARRNEMAELFRISTQYYQGGELEKAKQGFSEVAASGLYVPSKGKTAEQYIQEIEKQLSKKSLPSQQSHQLAIESQAQEKSGSWFGKKSQDSIVSQQTGSEVSSVKSDAQVASKQPPLQAGRSEGQGNIRSGYARAVVRNTHTKVAEHLEKNEFEQAKALVFDARTLVVNYQRDIDSGLYQLLMAELNGLDDTIKRRQFGLSK
ncbi:MAG: hypothetical protein WCZ89_03285 [Phycisphaerae bacterium]